MNELNEAFNNYIEEYKKLPVSAKREHIIDSLKEVIAVFDAKAQSEGIQLEYLKSKEILDLNKPDVSEDDYLEAALVYLEIAKQFIGEYFEKKGL